jgi:hypothetical protein
MTPAAGNYSDDEGMSGKLPARRKEDFGQLGPAMRALPNARWREFCYVLVSLPDGHGALARAARAAGFGRRSTPTNLAKIAWKLSHDDRMIAAIHEESKKVVRVGHPAAARALINMVNDPEHKDHARAVAMLLARTDPEIAQHDLQVTHRVMDTDREGLEELRTMRQLGVSREKMLEIFGGNGLARLEKLEAADTDRRADSAKVIDGEVIEESISGR